MGASRRHRRAISRALDEAARSPGELVAEGLVVGGGPHEAWALGRGLFVVPTIPEDAPMVVRNALAARREADMRGTCPACGAKRRGRAGGHHIDFFHEPWCPAGDDQLGEIARETGWVRHLTGEEAAGPLNVADAGLFELPGVRAKLVRARAVIGSYPPLCPHLRPENHHCIVLVCAQHAEAGLLCSACAQAHQRSHDARDDLACDNCGSIPADRLLKPILEVGDAAVWVDIDGRRHLIVARIAIDFLGVCCTCQGEAA